MSSDAFTSYLNNNVLEFKDYSKKYGTPSIKRINKMVQGIKMPAKEVLERGTIFKNTSFSIANEFNDVEEFIKYFRTFMIDVENNLRSKRTELFAGIESFALNSYSSIGICYKVQESDSEYKTRLKENERMKALNALIPVIQSAHETFLTARQEEINEQRKLSIQRKIEALQNELQNLDGE